MREEAEVRRSKIIAMLFSAFLCSDLLRFCAGDCFESFESAVEVIPSRGEEKQGR